MLGVDRFLAADDDVETPFREAIAADDQFAMAHIGLARIHQLCGRGAAARAALTDARERLKGVTDREATQVALMGEMIEGRAPQAYPRIRAYVAQNPTDVMLAQTCTSVFGLIGFSGQAGREAEQLAYTTMLAPHYGDDWWFLCQHAFAQMEAGQTGPAAANIERAIALNPTSAHSAHVRAHLYYETGESEAGLAYIQDFWASYPETAYMHCHISWHVALWALEQGHLDQMWQIFDTAVAPTRSPAPPLNVLTDSVALLFRAAAAGIAIPEARWQQVSDYAHRIFPQTGLAFADVHAALAHAMAGEAARLATVITDAKGAAGPVVRQLAQAFEALAGDEPDKAITQFSQVMAEHERIGGSRAQRDIIEISLASALLKSGKAEEARRTLAMRRPHIAQDHLVAGVTH